ncbi:hypothetical protein D3C74_280310 [compost metagenome]
MTVSILAFRHRTFRIDAAASLNVECFFVMQQSNGAILRVFECFGSDAKGINVCLQYRRVRKVPHGCNEHVLVRSDKLFEQMIQLGYFFLMRGSQLIKRCSRLKLAPCLQYICIDMRNVSLIQIYVHNLIFWVTFLIGLYKLLANGKAVRCFRITRMRSDIKNSRHNYIFSPSYIKLRFKQ